MSLIDYSREPKSDIDFVDMKSFYASVECLERGLNPLTTSLCVMSRSDNSKGLILASSPTFKRIFGKTNVSRAYELPFDINSRRFNHALAKRLGWQVSDQLVRYVEEWAKHTHMVSPRMDLYIQKNLELQSIFQEFASPEDILNYSIDESFIDLTSSLNYFIPDKSRKRAEKLDAVANYLQYRIWKQTGLVSTHGLSNSNPLLAKLALDNEAKKRKTFRANWSYQDVETKVWGITSLTNFWGIGSRTARRLEKLGIYTVRQLAHANPDHLKDEFGVMGLQLWFHANGVDESNVHEPYRVKSSGIGNSQILPRDYSQQSDIELVLKEMAEHLAKRLRKRHKRASRISIHISFSKEEKRRSINSQQKISLTNSNKDFTQAVLQLFRNRYQGGAVRRIAVSCDSLIDDNLMFLSLFDDYERLEKEVHLEHTIDLLQGEFGVMAVQKASSLLEASRVSERSKLIGGHLSSQRG